MTLDRAAARARCEAATAPNCGPGGVDITGGIRSDIYVRLDRDDCSDSIYDYIYELLASVRQLGQDGIAALDELDAKDKEIERLRKLLLRWLQVPMFDMATFDETMAALEGRDSE